jgi:hypothetical protein
VILTSEIVYDASTLYQDRANIVWRKGKGEVLDLGASAEPISKKHPSRSK